MIIPEDKQWPCSLQATSAENLQKEGYTTFFKPKTQFTVYLNTGLLTLATGFTIIWLLQPQARFTTPPPLDLRAVYSYIDNNLECEVSYLGLGFGYELPKISTHTNAKTPDGLWHTARRDPFLMTSGIGALSDSLYWENGHDILREYLSKNDVSSANCVFVNRSSPTYGELSEILEQTGWYLEHDLNTEASVWRNTRVISGVSEFSTQTNLYTSKSLALIWGGYPFTIFIFTVLVMIRTTIIKYRSEKEKLK